MDRFDCQFLMATFVNVYISSFIRTASPAKLLQQVSFISLGFSLDDYVWRVSLAGFQPETRTTAAAIQLTSRSSSEQKYPRFSGGRRRFVNHWHRTLTSIVRQRNICRKSFFFFKKLGEGIFSLLFHKQKLCVKNQSDFIFVSDQFYLFQFRLSCQSWAKLLEQHEETQIFSINFQLTIFQFTSS